MHYVAGAERDAVAWINAEQLIASRPAIEQVVSGAANEYIVAIPANENGVAAAPNEQVIPRTTVHEDRL
jgi:hypothetical protein